MIDSTNRRKFVRLKLTEKAVAVNERGIQLGPVHEAGGGGMLVVAATDETLTLMPVGRKMRVTVVEPGLGTTNKLDVEILYVRDHNVGMQFVSIPEGKE